MFEKITKIIDLYEIFRHDSVEQNYYREDYLTIAVYLATYGTAVSTDAVVDSNVFYEI